MAYALYSQGKYLGPVAPVFLVRGDGEAIASDAWWTGRQGSAPVVSLHVGASNGNFVAVP